MSLTLIFDNFFRLL